VEDKKIVVTEEVTEQYNSVCKPMFADIKQGLSGQESAISRNTESIDLHTLEIRRMSKKIFNGYGVTIQNMSDTLDRELKHNEDAHNEIKDGLKRLTGFGATSIVVIFVALLAILGSIWINDRAKLSEELVTQIRDQIKTVLEEVENEAETSNVP
jgi:hypothetical protein